MGQRLRKLLLGIMSALLTLTLVEVGLRVFQVGGSPRHIVALESHDGRTLFELRSPPGSPPLNPKQFSMPKPPGTYRIFVFGESSVYGAPYSFYSPRTSFSGFLEECLKAVQSETTFEVINMGSVGLSTFEILPRVREAVRYDPDLFIVYAGHNDLIANQGRAQRALERPIRTAVEGWLSDSALTRLLNSSIRRATQPLVQPFAFLEIRTHLDLISPRQISSAMEDWILGRFEENLREMIRSASAAKIPFYLCTLPANIRDYAPGCSYHREDLTPTEAEAWRESFDRASSLKNAGLSHEALEWFEKCLAVDEEVAEVHYLKGQCLEMESRYGEAKTAYERARDLDGYKIRGAIRRFQEVLDHVAASEKITLVDVRTAFEDEADHGLIGLNLIVDHVHPNLRGNQIIAERLARTLQTEGRIQGKPWDWSRSPTIDDYCQKTSLTPAALAQADLWCGLTMTTIGVMRHNPSQYFKHARNYLERGLAVLPQNVKGHLYLATLELLDGHREEARESYGRARSIDPNETSRILGQYLQYSVFLRTAFEKVGVVPN